MGLFGNSAALEKIDRDLAAIANGEADLSHCIGTPGGAIEGRISGNINRFFGRVRDLISHARERSVSIASDAARMNRIDPAGDGPMETSAPTGAPQGVRLETLL